MEWINVKERTPKQGNYITKNQYSQIDLCYWDCKEWTFVRALQGSCMLYDDSKVIFWKDEYGMD